MHDDLVFNRRAPAVAGSFYPDDPRELSNSLKALCRDSQTFAARSIKALIAPHAGYVYSGHTAASAFLTLLPQVGKIQRVVLIGPSHRVGFHGIATPSASRFNTPLGDVLVDRASLQEIETLPQVTRLDRAHKHEHSLEVELPFLQYLLEDFILVPLLVGECAPNQVAEVIDTLWGGDETLIVISSDLSHYHAYDEACSMDQRTTDSILNLEADAIGFDDACGQLAIRGLLLAARKFRLKPQLVELCNSGDTAGSKDRVVGYGAYIFSQ